MLIMTLLAFGVAFYKSFPSGIEMEPYGATQKMEVEGVKVIVR